MSLNLIQKRTQSILMLKNSNLFIELFINLPCERPRKDSVQTLQLYRSLKNAKKQKLKEIRLDELKKTLKVSHLKITVSSTTCV